MSKKPNKTRTKRLSKGQRTHVRLMKQEKIKAGTVYKPAKRVTQRSQYAGLPSFSERRNVQMSNPTEHRVGWNRAPVGRGDPQPSPGR